MVCLTLSAQQAGTPNRWRRVQVKDPITAKTYERFNLKGEYLSTPSGRPTTDLPEIVVVCLDGKLFRSYGLIRSVLPSSTGVTIDLRINDRRKTIASDAGVTKDVAVTDGKAGESFSTFGLNKLLPDLLSAHIIVMAVEPNSRGEIYGRPVMQFEMADPAAIVTACSKDKAVRDLQRKPWGPR